MKCPLMPRSKLVFRKGFNPTLKYALNLVKTANFEELVDTALKAEHGRAVFEESRKRSREGGSSSSSNNGPSQKRKMWVPNSALARGTYVPGSSGSAPRPPAPAPRTITGPPRPTGPRPGVTCYKCGQEGHISPQCPQNRLPPPPQPRPAPTQAMVRAPAPQRPLNTNTRPQGRQARVNHLNADAAQEALEVVLGTLSVTSVDAKVLFDTGASQIGRAHV